MHLAARYGHAANLTCCGWRRRIRQLAERISPDLPDLAAEAAFAVATSRRARWPTCCCAARGWACSTRAALCEDGAEGPARVARAMAGQLGLGRRARGARARRLARGRRAEGLVPSACSAACPPAAAPARRSRPRRAGCRPRGGGVILRLRDRELDLVRPAIMGIVNATPDSFSDRQGPKEPERARRARRCGWSRTARRSWTWAGESGRTDTEAVPVEVEIERVVPAGRAAGGGRACWCRSTPGAGRSRAPRSPRART